MSLGVQGEYLGRIYEQVKERPLYLVKEASLPVEADQQTAPPQPAPAWAAARDKGAAA
jgi:hypothetical protein